MINPIKSSFNFKLQFGTSSPQHTYTFTCLNYKKYSIRKRTTPFIQSGIKYNKSVFVLSNGDKMYIYVDNITKQCAHIWFFSNFCYVQNEYF